MRNLGRLGERHFATWCEQSGLVANKCEIDVHGWDYLVEFDSLPSEGHLDSHLAPMECKVQVKATDLCKRQLSVPLSNLLRLATAQMPSFYVFIEFDGKSTPQRAYVVHVDEHLITEILARVCELNSESQSPKLNKHTLTISYGEEDQLTEPFGANLKQQFESHIGSSMNAYVERKNSHLKSTGYENGYLSLDLKISGEDNFLKFLRSSLGINSETSVDVSDVEITDTRFGLKAFKPRLTHAKAKLEFTSITPSRFGKVYFKEKGLGRTLEFEAKLFVSPLHAHLDKSERETRVSLDFCDLLINFHTGKSEFKWTLDHGVRMTLSVLLERLKLLHMFSSSGNEIIATLDFDDLERIELNTIANDSPPAFADEEQIIQVALKILNTFEIYSGVHASLEDIRRQAASIREFSQILDISKSSVNAQEPTSMILL